MNKVNSIIISGFFFLFAYCSEEKIEPNIDFSSDEKNMPIQESWDSKIVFTEKGIIQGILYSDHLRSYEVPKEKLIDVLRIEFYNKSGKRSSVLTSKKGKIDDITQNMFAIDSVVAVNDSAGIKLETDQLMWRKKDQKIVTDKFVKITSDKEIIEGYGFESDQHLQNYVIYNITYQTTLQKNKQ